MNYDTIVSRFSAFLCIVSMRSLFPYKPRAHSRSILQLLRENLRNVYLAASSFVFHRVSFIFRVTVSRSIFAVSVGITPKDSNFPIDFSSNFKITRRSRKRQVHVRVRVSHIPIDVLEIVRRSKYLSLSFISTSE